MAIGIGIGIPFRRMLLEYPTKNLTGRYIQLSEGGDLINTLGGVSIPYVSGTGLDQIFNFGVLNDNIYDKGSYVGNSFGLPATYNFPYVNIYYDSTSATTRKYWKLKDFHYANILSQSLLVDDRFFLKAKATTNTSNILASVSELLIYSVAQSSTNLTKLKTYIGIQDDFYGNNILLNSDFNTNISNWSFVRANASWNVGKYVDMLATSSSSNMAISQTSSFSNKNVKITFKAKSILISTAPLLVSSFYDNVQYITNPNLNSSFQNYEYLGYQKSTATIIYVNTININDDISYDDIKMFLLYQNYYAS